VKFSRQKKAIAILKILQKGLEDGSIVAFEVVWTDDEDDGGGTIHVLFSDPQERNATLFHEAVKAALFAVN